MRIKNIDVIVIGGGHAGTEAASVDARMGANPLLVTMDIKNMEYKALDDRPLNTQNEEKKKEEEKRCQHQLI